jgi:hypothetical protein
MADDLLARVSAEIDGRLQELRPMLAEYERLRSAAEALGLEDGRAAAPAAGPSRAAKPKRGRAKAKAAATEPEPESAPAATGARRGAGRRGSAAGAIVRAGSSPPRAVRGAAQQAILAALEHGSHTVGELTVVTAMSGQNIRENLRRMLGSGAVTRAKREGKAAYALASAAASR